MQRILTIFAVALIMTGCYWGKELDQTATVTITPEFTCEDRTAIFNPKYVQYASTEAYQNKFLQALQTNLPSKNIVLADFGVEPDYELVITQMVVKETEDVETVKDEDSEYNGQSYLLNECDVWVEMTVYEGFRTRGNVIDKQNIRNDKKEKVKNNRTLGDLISGSNQNNNTYRQKLLADDIFMTLAEKTGRNAAGWLSNKIAKHYKKTGGY